MRRCIVKVASSVSLDGEKTENIFRVPGKYEEDEKSLSFNEKLSPEAGAPTVKTAIVIGDEIRVFRNEKLQFVFRQGDETESCYETIAGNLTLRIKTQKLNWEINEEGGSLYLEYELFYDENSGSECIYGISFEYAKR